MLLKNCSLRSRLISIHSACLCHNQRPNGLRPKIGWRQFGASPGVWLGTILPFPIHRNSDLSITFPFSFSLRFLLRLETIGAWGDHQCRSKWPVRICPIISPGIYDSTPKEFKIFRAGSNIFRRFGVLKESVLLISNISVKRSSQCHPSFDGNLRDIRSCSARVYIL